MKILRKKLKRRPAITFVIEGYSTLPVGGFKVIFEYANRLSDRGWRVTVVMAARAISEKRGWRDTAGTWRWYLGSFILRRYRPDRWFPLSQAVRLRWVPEIRNWLIPNAQCIIACQPRCADAVYKLSARKGSKLYLIQGFDEWSMDAERIYATWRLAMKKIVVSRWLQNLVAINSGQEALYVPNGLDSAFFHISVPITERKPLSVLFLWHQLPLKRSALVVEALRIVGSRYPNLYASAFGVYPQPQALPSSIQYYHLPTPYSLRCLYNAAIIFIAPSSSEGWDLPLSEAMLCGCIVVASDIPVHREFIADGENGFLFTKDSAEALAEKIAFVFDHPGVLTRISRTARSSMEKFSWQASVDSFEKILRNSADAHLQLTKE